MTELTITPKDITGLAAALDGLDLPERQKALLSALVAMAPNVVTVEITEPIPSFQEQFAAAFSAGKSDFTVTTRLGITRS